jgi:hypothetical protein
VREALKSRRVVALVAVLAVAAAATRVAAAPRSTESPSRVATCGVEHWAVKTLQDRPQLLRVQSTTLAHLDSVLRPASISATRLPSERHVYRVTASATLIGEESDQDLHVILRSGSKHLIAEAPNAPFCTGQATAYRKQQMRTARSRVRSCARARVVGVAFWDFFHGQTGVSPNVIELHPILGFTCLSGGGSPPPPPPPLGGKCAASYSSVCIPPPPPDLNCGDIPYRNFHVRWDVADPDPHHFDGDHDGVGCET